MFFEDFSGLRAFTEPKVVPYGRFLDNTLLKHVFSPVVFPARACHVIEVPDRLNMMVRAIAVTTARDLGSDSWPRPYNLRKT